MSSEVEERKNKNSITSSMSKKRLGEIKEALKELYGEDKIDDAINKICQIMKFDPDNYCKGVYSPEKGQKIVEYRRKKAAELGKTVYEVFHKKSAS